MIIGRKLRSKGVSVIKRNILGRECGGWKIAGTSLKKIRVEPNAYHHNTLVIPPVIELTEELFKITLGTTITI
jgi:hypothetical protein